MELAVEAFDKINILTKRDLERKLDIQRKKDDKDQHSADNEKLGYFEETFNTKCSYIENLLENTIHIDDKLILPNYFNDISKEILILQKYVAASNIFLRGYDIKKCHERLQELTTKSKELEEELLPKKKFGFKNKIKAKAQELKTNGHSSSKDEVDSCIKAPVAITDNFCGFKNQNDQLLVVTDKEIHMKDVSAENLTNCKVKFIGCSSTLHLNNLEDCNIFSGPVSTSIFVNNCINCTFVIACQQLRLHASKNIKIYLHVSSRAIMEDCENIFLASYNWYYDNIQNDFKNAGLDFTTNNWQCVDDFNWLNVEKHSPNWAVLDKESIENWKEE